MRALAIGLAIAILVFVATGGHFIFLPLLFTVMPLVLPRAPVAAAESVPDETVVVPV